MVKLKPRNHRNVRPRSESNGKPAGIQPIFSARVEPKVKEQAENWIKNSGWTKRQFLEFAIEKVLEDLPPEKAKAMRLALK